MAQEFFIDAGAAGTNSGDTPTDAFTGLHNFTNASSLPSSYDFGSTVWVRRTHVDCLHLSALGGYNAQLFIGPDGQSVLTRAYGAKCNFIGWPNSGDPWYHERSAAGISAGWDSDVSSSVLAGSYGWQYPVIVNSHVDVNDAYIPDFRVAYFNLAFQMANRSSAVAKMPIYFQDDTEGESIWDNIFIEGAQYIDFGTPEMNIRKMTIVCSYGGGNGPMIQINFNARHLIVHSLSANPDGIIADGCWIGHLENYCSSVPYVGGRDAGAFITAYYRTGYIGQLTGVEPYSSDIRNFVWDNQKVGDDTHLIVENYFGQGPAISTGAGSRNTYMVTSAEAMYDTLRVMGMHVRSMNAAHSFQSNKMYDDEPVSVRHISVESGQLYHVTFPFYQAHSAHHLAIPPIEAFVPFKGAGNFPMMGSGYINPGSLDNWSGTLVTGGSSWQGEFDFIAEETAEGTIRFFAGAPIAVSTNAWTLEERLFGAPTVNSAT